MKHPPHQSGRGSERGKSMHAKDDNHLGRLNDLSVPEPLDSLVLTWLSRVTSAREQSPVAVDDDTPTWRPHNITVAGLESCGPTVHLPAKDSYVRSSPHLTTLSDGSDDEQPSLSQPDQSSNEQHERATKHHLSMSVSQSSSSRSPTPTFEKRPRRKTRPDRYDTQKRHQPPRQDGGEEPRKNTKESKRRRSNRKKLRSGKLNEKNTNALYKTWGKLDSASSVPQELMTTIGKRKSTMLAHSVLPGSVWIPEDVLRKLQKSGTFTFKSTSGTSKERASQTVAIHNCVQQPSSPMEVGIQENETNVREPAVYHDKAVMVTPRLRPSPRPIGSDVAEPGCGQERRCTDGSTRNSETEHVQVMGNAELRGVVRNNGVSLEMTQPFALTREEHVKTNSTQPRAGMASCESHKELHQTRHPGQPLEDRQYNGQDLPSTCGFSLQSQNPYNHDITQLENTTFSPGTYLSYLGYHPSVQPFPCSRTLPRPCELPRPSYNSPGMASDGYPAHMEASLPFAAYFDVMRRDPQHDSPAQAPGCDETLFEFIQRTEREILSGEEEPLHSYRKEFDSHAANGGFSVEQAGLAAHSYRLQFDNGGRSHLQAGLSHQSPLTERRFRATSAYAVDREAFGMMDAHEETDELEMAGFWRPNRFL
ncbi:hypothetical protein S40293_05632 [Stachybotrys chartarum IBT 40293]|nr:hypothetical protein S40293_05632 [Stachybotrys chartarum IBT 40293]